VTIAQALRAYVTEPQLPQGDPLFWVTRWRKTWRWDLTIVVIARLLCTRI